MGTARTFVLFSPDRRGDFVLNKQAESPRTQAAGSLALAGAVVAAPAAGLVEVEVPMFLGAALVCLACVGTRLPWALSEVTEPFEENFGPSVV